MLSVNFHLNAEQLRQFAQNNVRRTIEKLLNKKDKTFQLSVDDNIYDIRYEIDLEGHVQLFVRSPETGDGDLIIPDLNLNIGDLLLPESMSLEDGGGFNPEVQYVPYKTLGSNSIPEHELRKIYDKIMKTGFVNLIKNNVF